MEQFMKVSQSFGDFSFIFFLSCPKMYIWVFHKLLLFKKYYLAVCTVNVDLKKKKPMVLFAVRLLACCIYMKCWSPSSAASLMRRSTLNWTHVRLTWITQGKSDLDLTYWQPETQFSYIKHVIMRTQQSLVQHGSSFRALLFHRCFFVYCIFF